MKNTIQGLGLIAALVMLNPGTATANLFNPFLLNSGNNNTAVANSVTLDGITAEGLSYGANTSPQGIAAPTPTAMWLRNQTDDHGLGVCSEGPSSCSNDGGDVNEISNQLVNEAIRLTRPLNHLWTSLLVSSLDSGGSNGAEKGRLFWSATANGFTNANQIGFSFGACDVECDLVSLLGLNGTVLGSRYLLFMNNPANGTNNDYLLRAASTVPGPGGVDPQPDPIPEPASLALLGLGLLGLGAARRLVR